MPIGQSYDPTTREGMLESINQFNTQRESAYDPRFDWSDEDWNFAIQEAMRGETRQGKNPGDWEYLVEGNWVDQRTYDDPKWRQNVYDPWASQVQNQWRKTREQTAEAKNKYSNMGNFSQMQPRGRSRYGGGRVGSRSSGGGGGGNYGIDPGMIAELIGG